MTGIWLVSYVALWILFLIVTIVLVSVLHHIGILYNKVEGKQSPPTKLTIGGTLPEVTFSTLNGTKVPVSEFIGNGTAFLIISPGCSGCLKALQSLANGDKQYEKSPIIVGLNDAAAISEMIRQVELPPIYQVLLDTENVLQEEWGVALTPILIETDEQLRLSRQTIFV